MTDQTCTHLEEATSGIINAYSWPTGMRNEGPEEYSLFFDPTETTGESVTAALSDALEQVHGGGFFLAATVEQPGDDGRANEGMDEQNEPLPALQATVYRHVAADDVHDRLESHNAVTWFNVTWEPDAGMDTWDDPRFLIDHPAAGRLSVFLEVKDNSQYDEVTDVVEAALPRDPSLAVDVVQGDSDEYNVEITAR